MQHVHGQKMIDPPGMTDQYHILGGQSSFDHAHVESLK